MSQPKRTPASASYPKRSYDLIRELAIALMVMTALTVALAAAFSSPDHPAVTLVSWAKVAPQDVAATAVAELAGTTVSAGYGPPYNNVSDGQHVGFFAPQKWAGVTNPVNSANDLVITPLAAETDDATLATAVTLWRRAGATTQARWATDYAQELASQTTSAVTTTAGDYGPVPILADRFLALARSGALDQDLSSNGDQTKKLLLLADGSYLSSLAQADHLTGSQWGMMNEAGSYPGQPWLWLYTFWYQVPGLSTSPNADILIGVIMAALTLALILMPFIPGLRSLPRLLRIHRLIWR